MTHFLEELLVHLCNWFTHVPQRTNRQPGVKLGTSVGDGQGRVVAIPDAKRPEHIAVLGKTGQGKSSLIKAMAQQDIAEDRGFAHIDLHGDATPYLLRLLAAEERRRGVDLSDRVIVIEPADMEYAVGINVLDVTSDHQAFVHTADVAGLLKQRWHLDAFGARTEELLRNSLVVLVDNRLTLLEVALLLTDAGFRTQCLNNVRHSDVRAYFEERYNAATEAMQGSWRDAALNKLTAFTTDPHFRHLLGQRRSTVSWLDAMDRGCWVLLNLDKGRLGEHAATLGTLFLGRLKHALFARQSRSLFTIYADELQNLVAFDAGIDTLLSEARKFGISICCANQFLEQYPPTMRAAVMAVGTHVFFQLSSQDADRIAAAVGGGHYLQDLLRNLPARQAVVKSGSEPWRHLLVPHVSAPQIDARSLYHRSRQRWAVRRTDVEAEITRRQTVARPGREALHDWQ